MWPQLNGSTAQSKGLVKWARNIRVKTNCDMDIANFPYDTQSCPITISSQDNSNEFLTLVTRKWNRLNNIDEDQMKVKPNGTITIEVSKIVRQSCQFHLSNLFPRISIIRIQMLGYSKVMHTKCQM